MWDLQLFSPPWLRVGSICQQTSFASPSDEKKKTSLSLSKRRAEIVATPTQHGPTHPSEPELPPAPDLAPKQHSVPGKPSFFPCQAMCLPSFLNSQPFWGPLGLQRQIIKCFSSLDTVCSWKPLPLSPIDYHPHPNIDWILLHSSPINICTLELYLINNLPLNSSAAS